MSRFSEYLTMVERGLQNLPNVVTANVNYYKDMFGALPIEKKLEAERRYNICNSCPFKSSLAKEVGFYPTQRVDAHCSACGCPIEKKVMSFDEECGLSFITNLVDDSGNKIVKGWVPLWGVFKQ